VHLNLRSLLILLFTTSNLTVASQSSNDCLFKNPLCFYNTDILKYLQILHKNQQYEKMIPFFYGDYVTNRSRDKLISELENINFGYTLQRVGIRNVTKNNWSLTYQRTILGTNENFKINSAIVNDTCRIYLDKNTFENIFKRNF
jgi:hypothetical protein